PDQVDSLFQPFNRLGQEAGAQEGTGIGLVVTRRLVELMGGTIDVTSSPGVGSVFSIELASTAPQASAIDPATQPGPGPVERAAGEPYVLLYVEDNPANLNLVEEIVRFRPDLRLLAAGDGPLGLSLARKHRPEIILMDLNLPGMSGLDVLKELRRDARTGAIPVIALTANAMASDVECGIEAGFFRYLTKPIDVDRFNEAIDGTLAHLRAKLRAKLGDEGGIAS
ncbi:MAG: response regulator, partial [Telluria sp.]